MLVETLRCSSPFQCSSISGCSTHINLVLRSSVTFLPSYSSPEVVLKSTTAVARALPEDFLYPLFITSSGSCLSHLCLLCLVWSLLLAITLNVS